MHSCIFMRQFLQHLSQRKYSIKMYCDYYDRNVSLFSFSIIEANCFPKSVKSAKHVFYCNSMLPKINCLSKRHSFKPHFVKRPQVGISPISDKYCFNFEICFTDHIGHFHHFTIGLAWFHDCSCRHRFLTLNAFLVLSSSVIQHSSCLFHLFSCFDLTSKRFRPAIFSCFALRRYHLLLLASWLHQRFQHAWTETGVSLVGLNN